MTTRVGLPYARLRSSRNCQVPGQREDLLRIGSELYHNMASFRRETLGRIIRHCNNAKVSASGEPQHEWVEVGGVVS